MVFFDLFTNDPEIVAVKTGEKLFAEGEAGHLMYVLIVGSAEVIVNNRVVETLKAGNIVGEMSIVSPGTRSATVIATADSQFVAIDEKRFHYLVQQAPYFASLVMKVMAERLRATNQLVLPVEDI